MYLYAYVVFYDRSEVEKLVGSDGHMLWACFSPGRPSFSTLARLKVKPGP